MRMNWKKKKSKKKILSSSEMCSTDSSVEGTIHREEGQGNQKTKNAVPRKGEFLKKKVEN